MEKQMKILLRPRDEIVAMHPLGDGAITTRFLIVTRQGYFYTGRYSHTNSTFTVSQVPAPKPE